MRQLNIEVNKMAKIVKRRRRKRKVRRECLRCGRVFMSEGNFNRICPSCREVNANIAMNAVEVAFDHDYYGFTK
jgi:uncharacterized OB-fold protein